MEASEIRTHDMGKGCLIIFTAFILVCIGIYTYNELQKTPEQKQAEKAKEKDYDNSLNAYVYATEFVKKRLISPSTATFGDMHETSVVKKYDNHYRICGYLDAQNEYGAIVRMTYTCDVTVFADQGQCDYINIDK